MTNEQMERKMEFIVETLARVAVNDEKHEMRLSRLEELQSSWLTQADVSDAHEAKRTNV